MSSVDHVNGILYYIGQEVFGESPVTLVGVSIETGELVSATPVPSVEPSSVLICLCVTLYNDMFYPQYIIDASLFC